MITIDSEHLGIPETEYGSKIYMPSAELTRICRELFTLSETVGIETKKGSVKFSVKSENVGGSIKLDDQEKSEESERILVQADEELNQVFALRYLNMFTKAGNLVNEVLLCMHPENPLKVEYDMGDVGNVKFYLAPRIDDEK